MCKEAHRAMLKAHRIPASPRLDKNFGITRAQNTMLGMIIIEAVPIVDFHDGPAMQRPPQKNTFAKGDKRRALWGKLGERNIYIFTDMANFKEQASYDMQEADIFG
jgi:hypothetical protein